MGQVLSRKKSGGDAQHPHVTQQDATRSSQHAVTHSSQALSPPTSPPAAFRLDVGNADESKLLLAGALRDAVWHALPPAHQHHWKLLYSSRVHGKNFTQMLKRTRQRGPTIVVIHEGRSEDGSVGRVFGGYNGSPWRTVSEREHDAKANAAAKTRSARAAAQGAVGETYDMKPDRQARQFFGGNDCFVFTSGALREAPTRASWSWSEAFEAEHVKVYPSRPYNSDANANYMYLMDTHPQTDRVGMGMGCDTPEELGSYAWLVDRYLSKGRCSVRLCPTFRNPRLSTASDFSISDVEVYGVDGDALDDDGISLAADNEVDNRPLAERHTIDKMVLQLHGTHFYSDENRELDC